MIINNMLKNTLLLVIYLKILEGQLSVFRNDMGRYNEEFGPSNPDTQYGGPTKTFQDTSTPSVKLKRVPVMVTIPEVYETAFAEQGNGELGAELSIVAESVAAAFNENPSVKNTGIQIMIIPEASSANPMDPLLNPSICSQSLQAVLGLITEYAKAEIEQHHIILMPCPSDKYADVFMGMDIGVPIVEARFNVVCTKHVAMFYEKTTGNLTLSYSNALMRILGSPLYEYVGLPESSAGDRGVQLQPSVPSNFIDHILNDRCFINIATT